MSREPRLALARRRLGAAELLRTNPPDAILFELNDAQDDLREHPTIRLLAAAGYGFFSIPRCYLRMRLLQYDHERDSTAPGHDFVAAWSGSVYADAARRLRPDRDRLTAAACPAAGCAGTPCR